MKNIYCITLAILFSVGSVSDLKSQSGEPSRDKFVLLTMPYNKRPLTLFRGQLQGNTGYKFAVRSQSFNSGGDLISLKNNGTGSVYHYYFVRLRYGLTNFLEIGVETDFLRRGIRDATVSVVSTTLTTTENVTINKLTESKGMGDIVLYTTLRLPVEFRWFDFGLRGGLFIPSAKYEPQRPTNTMTTSITAVNSYTIDLRYNLRNGYGVPVYMIAAASKLSYQKITAEAEWTMRTPVKEGKNINWEESLSEKVFSYYDKSYSFLLSNTYTLDISMHYQATGWFNFYLNGSFFKSKGGWTEYWGNKYKNPEKSLINLEPGFELQVSPSLTVYQVAGFPLKGKNCDAPFYLFTTISYNLFPFLR
ncbi:MAG: hypothetical protein MUC93_09120 [Bacteroidales bacterium]|jgi:hypothetical protein|nr:hypothetical protein [Bacteroidales bacterium]